MEERPTALLKLMGMAATNVDEWARLQTALALPIWAILKDRLQESQVSKHASHRSKLGCEVTSTINTLHKAYSYIA